MSPDISASYVCVPNLVQYIEFQTGKNGDVLIWKNADTEFTLKGVFQIACNDFYFTPDGNFDPANSFSSQFQDTKLSCRLTAPTSPDYQLFNDDFPKCVNNLRNLEKMIKPNKEIEIMSGLTEHLGKTQFKISHALFEVCDIRQKTGDGESNSTIADTMDDSASLGPEFAMESWPVLARCQPHLQELYETHDICPLPAFDNNDQLIVPNQYEAMLRGATVEVDFTYTHYFIKKKNKHIYSAVLRRMKILQKPSAIPTSPYK
ncbi:hypothetical protein PISMIDRAFT_108319 [Pisolithus microcarpus 441]|uniref:Uncharacterized protein n=1 Tax=Pisolithus microcarpus 441 TaxID=765257 RepID=A0A0C9Z9H5_9AGAM|nr:hypothetical protein BKA83DRAFT_108319 [Pisolithus microcarpus]KIK19107.1 hypothetical protein PISMIDRAFT_108319 [Pisolithus microcarpus 441]